MYNRRCHVFCASCRQLIVSNLLYGSGGYLYFLFQSFTVLLCLSIDGSGGGKMRVERELYTYAVRLQLPLVFILGHECEGVTTL